MAKEKKTKQQLRDEAYDRVIATVEPLWPRIVETWEEMIEIKPDIEPVPADFDELKKEIKDHIMKDDMSRGELRLVISLCKIAKIIPNAILGKIAKALINWAQEEMEDDIDEGNYRRD
jgi:hypothetical protein